ncbi:TPA: hypothetical protein ACS50C_004754 [Salmonella enterica]
MPYYKGKIPRCVAAFQNVITIKLCELPLCNEKPADHKIANVLPRVNTNRRDYQMKKIILLALVLSSITTTAFAAGTTLNGKYPVCISESAFNRLQAILTHKDEKSFAKIMTTECFMPKAGTAVDKVVSTGWTNGIAQVKIYSDGNLYDLWTNTESLMNKK